MFECVGVFDNKFGLTSRVKKAFFSKLKKKADRRRSTSGKAALNMISWSDWANDWKPPIELVKASIFCMWDS